MPGLLDRRRQIAEGLLAGSPSEPLDQEALWWRGLLDSYARQPTDVVANAAGVLKRFFDPAEWAAQARSLGNWPDPTSVMSKGILGSSEDIFNMVTNIAPLGIFKGINANLTPAETAMLQKAFQLEQQGMGREAIRQATNPPGGSGGWFRAPLDKKWRIEVDDSAAQYFPPKLSRIESNVAARVSHPNLFAAYPDLETMRFAQDPGMS